MFVEIQKKYLNPADMRLPFVLCTYGKNPVQGETCRPEGFDYHHVLWLERGSGIFTVDGSVFPLSEGEGVFCKRGVPHSYCREGEAFQTLWITFLCMDGILDYYQTADWFRFRVTPQLQRFALELDSLCCNSTILSRSAAGYAWLVEWLAQLNEPTAPTASRIHQYLENHFAEPLTLDDISTHARMDKYALCHAYKKEYGIPVMEHLKRIRIAKAKQLLRYTQYPVQEIANMCGYESPSYFGKRFREETGQPPTEYRIAHSFQHGS